VWRFKYGHTGLYSISFGPDRAYLALSLEAFLIARFSEELENKRRMIPDKK
jgi:hypothetical protein